MAQSGRVVLVYVNVGTEASPIYQAVAQQQGFDITRGKNTTSVGHKDSADEVVIGGSLTQSWNFTGLKVPSDLALSILKSAYRADTEILVRWEENGVYIEEMVGIITDFNESHPHDGVSTYDITVQPVDQVSDV